MMSMIWSPPNAPVFPRNVFGPGSWAPRLNVNTESRNVQPVKARAASTMSFSV
jgi:hypothetical protein